jgi:hypothetical protein
VFGVLRRTALAGAVIAVLATAPAALADGTETLGPPSIAISNGTGVAVAGVGTQEHPNAPVALSVGVPSNALIKQVLVYWEGHVTRNVMVPDPTIELNGNTINGQLIGGDTNFFASELFSTYRADITNLNLVKPGANVLTASGMFFESTFVQPSGNDGIGLVVIYDQGTPSTFVGLKDGQDLAFAEFASPLDTTVPQTFGFTASNESRTAALSVLAGSVSGPDLSGLRGNVITGSLDGGAPFVIAENALQSNNGAEFDAVTLPVTIPAGATSLTVQLLSQGGVRPASLSWIAGTLSVDEPPPPPPGGQGCTPGYWKNHLNAWVPTGFSPNQALSSVFSPTGLGTLGTDTLLGALQYKGGSTLQAKKQILLRAAVASLLNAAHPDVAFGSGPASVISAVNAALESNDADTILALATDLDDRNNMGCRLN